MLSPVTWQAVEAIAAELAFIRTANTFRTDIGANVQTEPLQEPIEEAPVVMVGLDNLDRRDVDTQFRVSEFTVICECAIPTKFSAARRTAHDAIADLLVVFPSSSRRLTLSGGLQCDVTAGTRPTARILDRPEGIDAVIAQVQLLVTVREYE